MGLIAPESLAILVKAERNITGIYIENCVLFIYNNKEGVELDKYLLLNDKNDGTIELTINM